jgi:hypothetical protein
VLRAVRVALFDGREDSRYVIHGMDPLAR